MSVIPSRFQQIVILAVIIPLYGLVRLLVRSGPPIWKWHRHKSNADIMQRLYQGNWQYRAMTDEEHKHYIADRW